MKIYGYARVSTQNQRLQRQITNISRAFPEVSKIFQEKYTGTTADRPEWKKLLRTVKAGDTIVFDSVSRMSRDAAEGAEQYMELYEKGINLVFLNEPHINTDAYRTAAAECINMTGNEIADEYIAATNRVLKILARKQIILAFEQAQKERDDIAERVKQGKAESKRKRLADPENPAYQYNKGQKLETKKAKAAKAYILENSKDYGGNLTDEQCMKCAGISRNSFYKYKRELKEERFTAEE